MISLIAHIEPPTQYWREDRDRRLACVFRSVFECHSNMVKPFFVASFSPHRGSLRIEPDSASSWKDFIDIIILEGERLPIFELIVFLIKSSLSITPFFGDFDIVLYIEAFLFLFLIDF